MEEFLENFERLEARANPPVSKVEIKELEKALQIKLPKDLLTHYSAQNGQSARGKLPWRFMAVNETREINARLGEEKVLPTEARIFWTDDEGNYAGVYFDGPLKGKVGFFDHEERDFAPRFKTTKRFLEALVVSAKQGQDWREMPTDFGNAEQAGEQSTFEQLSQQFRSATDPKKRRQSAFDLIALIPATRAVELLAFLDDEDLLVQERAAEMLGKYRFEAAIPLLAKVAERETTRVHNARIGAILAIGRMKSPIGLETLMHLSKTIPTTFHSYIFKALELHGCKIKFDSDQWKYQLGNEWHTL